MSLATRLPSPADPVFDPEAIRPDFPALAQTVNGKPLIYLDNAASAQKPRQVMAAMQAMSETGYANIHRGVHTLSRLATEAYEAARARVARFLNAARPEEIVFTRNATEAINLVAHAWGRSTLQPGDEILITELEHHANIIPWQMVAGATGARIRAIPMTPEGSLDLETLPDLIGPRTRIVAVTAMSNALGIVVPLPQILAAARAVGAVTLVDGSQAVVHGGVDVQAIACDFLVFTGHKLYGPTGIGVLYGRHERLEAMPPWQGGGDMIETVAIDSCTFAAPPARFEAGTPPILEAVGLARAIDYIEALGLEQIQTHERRLLDRATRALEDLPGLRILGRAQDKAAILSFVVEGVHPHDLGHVLDRYGVAVRTGHHCAMPLMARLGVGATTRASFAAYNTLGEADQFGQALARSIRLLKE